MMRNARFLLAVPVVVAVVGCPEEPPPVVDCVPDTQFFADDIWGAFMGSQCYACHNAQGIANGSEMVLRSASEPGFLEANFEIVKNVAAFERDGTSILLLKPSAQIDHGGGEQIKIGDEKYQALEALIARFESPTICENVAGDPALQHIELLDPERTFRKAAIIVGGRLPTADESAQLRGGDVADLDAALDNLLEEEGFSQFVRETYNDLFLTDRYARDERAIDLLDDDLYPNREWYDEIADGEQRDLLRRRTNLAVSREALELVAYVARHDLPFTEILTADYTMVNAYSARVYGVAADFRVGDDDEFVPARIDDLPHAGVLTSAMWLNRFPTTDTNRNRHRARMIFKFFLATDILRLADRPVDSAAIADFNPTRENPQCTVCHANIDPVAGTLQAWNGIGLYSPPEGGWYQEMFAPGYKDQVMPFSESNNGAQWLAQQIANDPLFSLSAVHNFYRGLTGREPLSAPPADDPAYEAKNAAYLAQDAELQRVAAAFNDSGMRVKVLVKELVKSPYFRANATLGAPPADLNEALSTFGTARFLTPELLNRKIAAVTGQPWTRQYDSRQVLLDPNEYLIFYGGIDSDTVTQRISEPNGLMAAVAQRMATEQACRTTARDFVKPPSERLLFPLVEPAYLPEDQNGFEVPAAKDAIVENIVYLHDRVLGEQLGKNDEEIQQTYQLWLTVWRQGTQALASEAEDAESTYLPGDCRVYYDVENDTELPEDQQLHEDPTYAIRAWMAVMTYLLSDYRFLHE